MTPRSTVAATLAAAVALTAPTAASAKLRVENAMFDVSIKGYQVTTWSQSHESRGGCDVNTKGSGSETMRFRSRKVRLRSIWVHGQSPLFVSAGADADPRVRVPLRTRVTRQGDVAQWGDPCSEGDGTGTGPAAKDCGTKYSNALAAQILYESRDPTRLGLGSDFGSPPDLFANCPAGPLMWPKAVTTNNGRMLGRRVGYRELFHGAQQHILRIGATIPNDTFEVQAKTEVGWELTITRVRSAGTRRR
jgi:hypothetical protein